MCSRLLSVCRIEVTGCYFSHISIFLSALLAKTQEAPGDQALGEPRAQEGHQAQDPDDSDGTSADPVLGATSPANMQL